MQKSAALFVTGIMAAGFFGPALAADLSSEWPTYGHDAGGMRFSPLTQVTPANVNRLEKAWTFHMRPAYLDNAAANPPTAGRGGRGGARVHRASGSHSRGPSAHQRRTKPR